MISNVHWGKFQLINFSARNSPLSWQDHRCQQQTIPREVRMFNSVSISWWWKEVLCAFDSCKVPNIRPLLKNEGPENHPHVNSFQRIENRCENEMKQEGHIPKKRTSKIQLLMCELELLNSPKKIHLPVSDRAMDTRLLEVFLEFTCWKHDLPVDATTVLLAIGVCPEWAAQKWSLQWAIYMVIRSWTMMKRYPLAIQHGYWSHGPVESSWVIAWWFSIFM